MYLLDRSVPKVDGGGHLTETVNTPMLRIRGVLMRVVVMDYLPGFSIYL